MPFSFNVHNPYRVSLFYHKWKDLLKISWFFFFPRPGFGGRKCDQCEENFWGNPKIECIPCNCNTLGVDPDRTQCDHSTGECFCLEGNENSNFISRFKNLENLNVISRGSPYMQWHDRFTTVPITVFIKRRTKLPMFFFKFYCFQLCFLYIEAV